MLYKTMSSLKLTDGIIVLVESDRKGEWYAAFDWQANEFIKAMEFGTMKSMCYPNPRTETAIFKHRGIRYKFIIIDDWGPCYMKNIDSGKEREIKYFELGNIYNKKNSTNYSVKKSKFKFN
jgi:hypothetical protein